MLPTTETTAKPEASTSAASAIQTQAAGASFSVSARADSQTFGSVMDSSRLEGRIGSVGATGGGGRMSGRIGGISIETKKLGVILDVTKSGQPYLYKRLAEINKQFPGMPIVMVYGGALKGSADKSKFKIKTGKAISDLLPNAPMKPFTTLYPQIADCISGKNAHYIKGVVVNSDEIALFKTLLIKPNVFVLDHDLSLSTGNAAEGTSFAFEHLAGLGVDTVYWFSDFEDTIDDKGAENLLNLLKSKRIKLIAANFSLKPYGNNAPIVAKNIPKLKDITAQVGGKYVPATEQK